MKKEYPLPEHLQMKGIAIYLLSMEKKLKWVEDVKAIYPDYPFDQATLRSIGLDYSSKTLPPMFQGQKNLHPEYKDESIFNSIYR